MNAGSGDSEKLFEEIQKAARRTRRLPRQSASDHRSSIPNYLILEEIHRGGQGVVFKAVQESTRRIVALKFILHGSFATERQRFRFEREIDLASRLSHPNIVTIYDGGIANGQPFCAMEFVDGQPLNEFSSGSTSKSSCRKSVDLFRKICLAAGYAHSRGVVHRDFKPGNILIDRAGEPHILDFGLAKVLNDEKAAPFSPHTMTGEFVGTLSYASPEQAKANPELTDTRSDVYSLGVVFYELLTGKMPYDVTGSIVETLTNITSAEPARPTLARRGLDPDIETILLKALSKDPERRYQKAGMLADDLRRFLNGEPIEARRDSIWYVLKKTVVRYRHAAVAAVLFVSLLIIALVAISIFYFQAIGDRDFANQAKLDEQKQRQIAQRETAAAETARMLEAAGRKEAEFRTYVAHLAASDSSIRVYDVKDALRNLSNAPEKYRAFEWWYLLGRIDLSELSIGSADATGEIPFTGDYRSVDYSPDGNWLVTGNAAGMVLFWTKKDLDQIAWHYDCGSPIQRLRVHPNGNQVTVGFGPGDAMVLDVDASQGELRSVRPSKIRYSTLGLQLHALEYSPDGKFLVLACGTHPDPGKVLVYESATGELVRAIEGHKNPVWCVAVSRDGRLIASADNEIRIWNLDSGELLTRLPGHKNWVWDLAFHPDSNQLASCALEQEVRIWDIPSQKHLTSLTGHTSFVNAIEYSDDGKLLGSVSEDRTIRFWDTDTYASSTIKWGHVGGITDIAFGPQGEVATAGSLCIKTWDSRPEADPGFGSGFCQKILDIDVSPDSKRMLVCDNRGSLVEWNLGNRKTGRIAVNPPQHEIAIRSVSYSPIGDYAAWSRDDGNVCLFNFKNKQTAMLSGHTASVNSVVFSSDGTTLFSASDDKTVLRWDLDSQSSTLFCTSALAIKKVSVSGNGGWMATADELGITIWDAATGERVASIPRQIGYEAENFTIAFNPAGTRIAAPMPFGFTGVWSVPDGSEVARMGEHTQVVQSVAWSSDGKRIATASRDGTVKLWDCERFQVVLTLRGFNGYCEAIAFSPDNLRLVAGMYDGSIRLWNTLAPERRNNK